MEARRQIGIKGGYVGILGRWKGGKYIRLIEPISVACSAPPGTGKTAALVVPSIVESPDISMIVNDPKRSEEHTSELQSLMRISYAVFCLKKKINKTLTRQSHNKN